MCERRWKMKALWRGAEHTRKYLSLVKAISYPASIYKNTQWTSYSSTTVTKLECKCKSIILRLNFLLIFYTLILIFKIHVQILFVQLSKAADLLECCPMLMPMICSLLFIATGLFDALSEGLEEPKTKTVSEDGVNYRLCMLPS